VTDADAARDAWERETRWGVWPAYVHPGWAAAFPWLVQGCTGRLPPGSPEAALDPDAFAARVARAAGFARVARVRQVHGAGVRLAEASAAAPLPCAEPAPEGDALVTAEPGLALVVLVADCVPVFLLDPGRRALGLAHAGWRGTAAGVLEATVASMASAFGSHPADLRVHLGPSICGRCYEVGAEVFEALRLPAPAPRARLDLGAELARRARALGVPADAITRSRHCTRCDAARFHSYRREGQRAGRMAALLAVAGDAAGR
jgi:YfiH family protein